jgi:hypothetical protein
MLKAIVEKLRYWAYFTFYFLLIPVSIARFYIMLCSKPAPVTRTLRDVRFLRNRRIYGRQLLQDGVVTDACGFLMDLTVEKDELVAMQDGYRYVIANVIPTDKNIHLQETLCDLWLPGPAK